MDNHYHYAPSPHSQPLGRSTRYNYFPQEYSTHGIPPPLTQSNRNFVPFLHTPASDHQESLYWRNNYPTNQNESQLLQNRPIRALQRPSQLSIHSQKDVINPRNNSIQRYYSGPETSLEMPSHPQHQYSPTYPQNHQSSPTTAEGKEGSKKWTFGGLFRRKEKVKSPTVPISIQFDPTNRSSTILASPESESSPESEPRHNFLRRLSKKKKKSSGNGTKTVEGFLKVPSPIQQQQYRRSIPEFQSWETTKKCPPMLLGPNNNYSSSGSLSLSMEGSSSLSRGSRAAAKEAVKARAEARRESILVYSSSGEEAEDELGSNNNGHGSHSSLSLRGNRRSKGLVGPIPHNNGSKSPQLPHRVSNSSPNLNVGVSKGPKTGIPPSPRWEARIVYTQETIHDDEKPVVVKLPKRLPTTNQKDLNGNPNYSIETTETISEDTNVITAGLRLPLSLSSSYPKTGEPIYANLKSYQNFSTASSTPPPPPRRDFYNHSGQPNPPQNLANFYRPVSCSQIESYPHRDQISLGFRSSLRTNSPMNNGHMRTTTPIDDNRFQSNGIRNYHNDPKRYDWSTENKEPILTYEVEPTRYIASPSRIMSNIIKPNTSRPEITNHQLNSKSSHQQPMVMSKLGFPVRKLHENSTSPTFHSSPIQNPGASEFWRKKEVTNLGKFGYSIPSNSTTSSQSQAHALMNRVRIRSADSSPLSVPKHLKNLPGILRSNESISSLSSFSAETPSPNIFSKNNNNTSLSSKNSIKLRKIKSPEFKISSLSQTSKELDPKSACERLNVKRYSASPEQNQSKSTTPQPIIVAQNGKSPGKNLEDALNELEDMYKSLRLSDEDLLDRAERRDLPTVHQQLRGKDPLSFTSARFFHFSPLGSGSLESIATTSGSGSTDNSRKRARAPPLRRSGIPDLINDDMAKRKYDTKETPKVNDPREVVSQSGSYLMLSPAFSPPVSPCPGEIPLTPNYIHHPNDPDLTTDDVAVRNYRRANSIRIIEEPQPLFGVPLGPITKAPPSDYLHAIPIEKFRPLFRHVKNPDLVKDDQAFRTLRKDLNQENNLSKDWTPRLFSPLRGSSVAGSSDSIFTYNIQPDTLNGSGKKLRAIRSLSANISHLINPPMPSSLREEIGKWNSFTDLNGIVRSSRSLTPARASTYLEPSWVEQANLEEFGTSYPFYRPASPNSTIKKKFKLIKPNKSPVGQVSQLDQRISPDPNAPRRPWTDIILQSYENDNELEQQQDSLQPNQEYVTITSPIISEEDNDVFLDASATTPPPSSPLTVMEQISEDVEMSSNSFISVPRLLTGQKDRRGSYVDPKSPSLISQSEEVKRRSWSDVPKQYESFNSAYEAIAGTPKKIIFTPLPPPRRIKQISLDGFSGTNNESLPFRKSEKELNDLIDALVKEAHTCGNPTYENTSPEPIPSTHHHRKKRSLKLSASLEKESKWQAAIAQLESSSSPQPTDQPITTFKKSETCESNAKVHTQCVSDPPSVLNPSNQDLHFDSEDEKDQSELPQLHYLPRPPNSPVESNPVPSQQPRGILKKRPEEAEMGIIKSD